MDALQYRLFSALQLKAEGKDKIYSKSIKQIEMNYDTKEAVV